jgi:hypothetical protein
MGRAPLRLAATTRLAAATISGSDDSMRVPPAWTTRTLRHPQRTGRPRRGPESPACPPARISITISAGPGASAQDLERAEFSARTLGVPGAGRD